MSIYSLLLKVIIYFLLLQEKHQLIKALVGVLVRFVGKKAASVFLIQNSLGNEEIKEVDINVIKIYYLCVRCLRALTFLHLPVFPVIVYHIVWRPLECDDPPHAH